MILTEEQNKLIEDIIHWFKYESKQVFQFSGEAGTGKSVVLNEVKRRLGLEFNNIAPMAYIGQAAIVMRLKGLINAKTSHSWLFQPVEKVKVDKNNQIIMDPYFNKPKTTLGFEPVDLDPDIQLIMIDEGPTIPRSMKYHIERQDRKVLVAGDIDQLPPVNDEPAYLVDGDIRFLTQPMRQAANSGRYYISQRAKKGLPIYEGYYGDCIVINEDDLTDRMILNSDILICGTNKSREKYTKYIRNDLLKITNDLPQLYERLICRKNNWNYSIDGISLANGLIGEVIRTTGVEGFDYKGFTIDFKPKFINNYFDNLYCDYEYFSASYDKKQFLKNNKYNRGEKFDFAYAITCHLSQGGQFNNGIYIEEHLFDNIQKNLNYTGITRFDTSLIYVKKRKKYYFHF